LLHIEQKISWNLFSETQCIYTKTKTVSLEDEISAFAKACIHPWRIVFSSRQPPCIMHFLF